MKLLNKLEKLESLKEFNIGDILGIYKDNVMDFYLFLGFNMGFNRNNLLTKYFDGAIKLQPYEYYERDIIDDIGVQSLYYNIIQLRVNRKLAIPEDYNKDIFVIPEKTDKYILDILADIFTNGTVSTNAIGQCRDFYSNSTFQYKISNVIEEKAIKQFILKLQLTSKLDKGLQLESYSYIENKLREGYIRRKNQLEVTEQGILNLIKEQKVDAKPIQYMLYGKTVKDSIRLYICLGYNYKEEVVYVPIGVVPKEELNLKDLQVKFNTKYWLERVLMGKKLMVGYRPFYRLGIQAEPPSTNLRGTNRKKLQSVGMII